MSCPKLSHVVYAGAVVITGSLTGPLIECREAAGQQASAPKKQKIDKLYFLIHPTCWSMGMKGDDPPAAISSDLKPHYLACYAREKKTLVRQKEFIGAMKPNEALILYPIGDCREMLDLERHATETLGDRCIVVRTKVVAPPAAWAKLGNPIEQYLADDSLAGRAEFLKSIPPAIQTELMSEIREACQTRGSRWSLQALKVIYNSRLFAQDIRDQWEKQGLTIDPLSVESEAFGEGFEECAMTWKTMVVPYLGFAKPAENNYELSVSGLRFLDKARFKERVPLAHEIRLYLWQGDDGEPIGFFARSWCRLKDPRFHIRVPLDGSQLEVWTIEQYGTRLWPVDKANTETNK